MARVTGIDFEHSGTFRVLTPDSQIIWFGQVNISAVLMQFTGLTDKNGKEIYEGDILSVENPDGYKDLLCLVEYDSNVGGYEYTPKSGYGEFETSTIGWAMGMEFEFEIIGNIYENPELLEGAK